MRRHIHFIGIGGIGMSSIASILLRQGQKVSGSDIRFSLIIEKLRKEGAEIFFGHSPHNIRGADIVVYTSAIKEDNPELTESRRQGLEVFSRAEMLAEIMKGHTIITVAGAHGKTTTASLVSHLLYSAGFSPTVAIGGILADLKDNVLYGRGAFFVAEADESDGSFLCYSPTYSIVTNLDFEHMDFYGSEENLFSAFRDFIGRTRDDGMVFVCADDGNLRRIAQGSSRKYLLFGLREDAHIYAKDILLQGFSSEFTCFINGRDIGRFLLPLAGLHNISNALAAIALGYRINIEEDIIRRSLASFKGVDRRFQIKIKLDDERIIIVEDYAHHPTEIKRTLEAARSCGYDRLICVFQPHRYTRTKLLMNEFTRCFEAVDCLIVTDIYAAGERPLEGIDAKLLYRNISSRLNKRVEFLAKEEIPLRIEEILRPGDFVIVLGAGDITKVCDELVKRLERKIKV